MIFDNGSAAKLGKLRSSSAVAELQNASDKFMASNLSTYRARISPACFGATRREREREEKIERYMNAAFCKLSRNRGSHVKGGGRDELVYHRDEIFPVMLPNKEEDIRFLSRLIFRHVNDSLSLSLSLFCNI